jgi:(p)ppGpp synthase/HD superfamily hydrolase
MLEPFVRFSEAIALASRLHKDQRRRLTGGPYLAHLLRVSGIVWDQGADETTAIAALLHDAVEDQGGLTTRELIVEQFGPEVARLVDECSDTDQSPKPPWQERKEAFIATLDDCLPESRLIIAADKLDNVRCLLESFEEFGGELWSHFRGGRDGTIWYYRSVTDRLASDSTSLVRQLDREVDRLSVRTAL